MTNINTPNDDIDSVELPADQISENGKRITEVIETPEELAPPEGYGELEDPKIALKSWLSLVLQDINEEDVLAGTGIDVRAAVSTIANYPDTTYEDVCRAFDDLGAVAYFAWGDGAPMGYGNGPSCAVLYDDDLDFYTLDWAGSWTKGRFISWNFVAIEHPEKGDHLMCPTTWNTGTGNPSRFMSDLVPRESVIITNEVREQVENVVDAL